MRIVSRLGGAHDNHHHFLPGHRLRRLGIPSPDAVFNAVAAFVLLS